jgi:hypothetical protein
MNYQVRWVRSARDALAALWIGGLDRGAVTRAAHQIDVLLARDPNGVGESRDRGRRILIEKPLAVDYRVQEQTRVVTVLAVRASSSRP